MVDRGGDEPIGDLGVDVVERVGRLVHVVERDGIGHEVGRRMSAGAQEAPGDALDRGERLDGDVLGAPRPEPDDDDSVGSLYRPFIRGRRRDWTS